MFPLKCKKTFLKKSKQKRLKQLSLEKCVFQGVIFKEQCHPVQPLEHLHCAQKLESRSHDPIKQLIKAHLSITLKMFKYNSQNSIIITNVAEWTTITIITVASISPRISVIENAFSRNARVFVTSSQILTHLKEFFIQKWTPFSLKEQSSVIQPAGHSHSCPRKS